MSMVSRVPSSQYLRPWVKVRRGRESPTSEASLTAATVGYVLDGARETLVLLGIVVLQADLQIDCLQELPWFGLGVVQHLLDALVEGILRYFGPKIER